MCDTHECEVRVLYETDDAFLCVETANYEPGDSIEDDDKFWIPKSEIDDTSHIDKDSQVGDEGELIIPEWLAVEKRLV